MDKPNFVIGNRVRIASDYSDPALQNQIGKILALPNQDNEYLVRILGGQLDGRGVLIHGDCLHKLTVEYGIDS